MYKSRGKTSTRIQTNRCNEPGELLRNIAYKNTHFTLIFHVLTKRYFLIKAKKKKKIQRPYYANLVRIISWKKNGVFGWKQ